MAVRLEYDRKERTLSFFFEGSQSPPRKLYETRNPLHYCLDMCTDHSSNGHEAECETEFMVRFRLKPEIDLVTNQYKFFLILYLEKGWLGIASGQNYGVGLMCNQGMVANL